MSDISSVYDLDSDEHFPNNQISRDPFNQNILPGSKNGEILSVVPRSGMLSSRTITVVSTVLSFTSIIAIVVFLPLAHVSIQQKNTKLLSLVEDCQVRCWYFLNFK